MLKKSTKQQIIKDHGRNTEDTGSPEVQVALLTESITELTNHLKKHKKDNHSRRGLIKQVMQRRKLLNYLKKKNVENYQALIKKLGLKK